MSALALILHREPGFPSTLRKICGLEFDDLREPMEAIFLEGVKLEQQNELVIIKNRYDKEERYHVGGYHLSTMAYDFLEEKRRTEQV